MSVSATPEDIYSIVEPLVDALSQLVLEALSGSLANCLPHCVKLSNATVQLVHIAQNVALQSDGEALAIEITEIITGIANGIDQLVTAFTSLAENRTDTERAKVFSQAAKHLGDLINDLILATDETSRKRMTALIRKAIECTNELSTAVSENPNRSKVNNAGRVFSETNTQLVDVSRRAARASSNEQKKRLLTSASDDISYVSPQLVELGKGIADSPEDNNLVYQFRSLEPRLTDAYRTLIEGLKIEATDHFAKLAAVVEIALELLDRLKALQARANELVKHIEAKNKPNIKSGITEVESALDAAVKIAQSAVEHITDVIRRQVLRGAIEELKRAAGDLIAAAKAALNDDPRALALARAANAALQNAAQKLVLGTKGDAMVQYPIHLGTEALQQLSAQVVAAAEAGDMQALFNSSQELSEVAKMMANELIKKANATKDPQERARLLALADEIKRAALDVIAAAKNYAQNPTPENKAKLDEAHRALQNVVAKARGFESTPAGFAPVKVEPVHTQEHVQHEEELNLLDLEPLPNDHPLVRAAKEQALAALEVIREAEKTAANDPKLQAQVAAAASEVRKWIKLVMAAAKKVAANPDDAAAQAELSKAQQGLQQAIQKLVVLTGKDEKSRKELEDALKGLEDAVREDNKDNQPQLKGAGEFLQKAEAALLEIQQFFAEAVKLDVKDGVVKAKELFAKVSTMAKLLEEMAATITVPSFKTQLINASKILRDNALKMKILATVKAASGEDESGQLAAAARGLGVQIKDIVNDVRALSLRHRVEKTEAQARALKKIAEAVRRGRMY